MIKQVRILLSSALLLGPLPAVSQDTISAQSDVSNGVEQDAEGDTIVVTGRTQEVTGSEVQRQARAITDSPQHRSTPLARFEDRLCVGVLGMREDFAGLLIDRVRENAATLDIGVQGDGCNPNFVIAFVPDSQASLSQIVASNSGLFQNMNLWDRHDMLLPAPAHVWLKVEMRTRDGMPMSEERVGGRPLVSSQQMAHSLIYTSMRRDITYAMVFFDLNEIDGLSVRQLADYATMRGLVQTRPSEGMALTSILGLFDPDGLQAAALTDFDMAYLTAVYDGIPNLPAIAKLTGVSRELRQIADVEDALLDDEAGQTPQ